MRWLFLALALLGVMVVALGVRMWQIPGFAEFRDSQSSSFRTIYDRHGEVLLRTRSNDERLREEWVPLSQVSQSLLLLLLEAEDKRFVTHAGVDYLALLSSIKQSVWQGIRRGGSTLDMQVVRLMSGHSTGGLGDKLRQILDALLLNARWSKAEILEAYINLVPLKGEREGFLSMSTAWWQKSLLQLNEAEAAFLVALPRSPNAGLAKVVARACALRPNRCAEVQLQAQVLRRNGMSTQLAPHLKAHLGPDHQHSSVDAQIQKKVQEILRTQLLELRDHQALDAAAVVLDNASGEVLAYVGSVAATSRAVEVDMAKAKRLAGSTLKPFLYALALAQKKLVPDSILDDSPFAQAQVGGTYRPQNFNQKYQGPVPLAEALAGSLNIPAVRSLELVGPRHFLQLLKEMQVIQGEHDADYYGLGLALGGAEVSLLMLTNAYRMLAQQGQWSPPVFHLHTTPATQQLLPANSAEQIAQILHDRGARASSFGFDSVLATRLPTAVKTGTSKNMRDNWCIGFGRTYTVGVWVGNADGAPMREVSGVTGAAPAWAQIIESVHEDPRLGRLTPPSWAKTLTTVAASPSLSSERVHILNPGAGAVYALDPDVSAQGAMLHLRVSYAPPGLRWRLNQQWLSKGIQHLPLPPPGQHSLSIWQGDTKIEELSFRVAAPYQPSAKAVLP